MEYDTIKFEEFWKMYPNKKAKVVAKKAWAKITDIDTIFTVIMSALDAHKKTEQWTKSGGKFIPHPATWLNQRRWEDELETEINNNSKFNGI